MRCAVLGDPIEHSLSPVLHRAGYDALGLGWSYDAVRVASGDLAAFLGALDDSWRGLSLTMPLKRAVLPLGEARTDDVELSGAANTVVLEEGRRELHNTDIGGAAKALGERYDGSVGSVSIVGAGATAASVGLALCGLGAREVTLFARSAERAAETVAALRRHPGEPRVEVVAMDTQITGDVVVSTVPAAAQDDDLVARCTAGSGAAAPVVFEVLYDPWPTPLAAAARRAGGVLVGGLDLLVHQAALQFELFTGEAAPLEAMRTSGERALAERAGR